MKKYINLAILLAHISTVNIGVAQAQAPIMFGPSRNLSYVVSKEPYNLENHEKQAYESLGRVWGNIFFYPNGKFEAWGYLAGAKFYVSNGNEPTLISIDHGDVNVVLIDYTDRNDFARIRGILGDEDVIIDLKSRRFFEEEIENPEEARTAIEQAVHKLFYDYYASLNLRDLKKGAEKAMLYERTLHESIENIASEFPK